MIAYLKGKLLKQNNDRIIVDVNGVGYELLVGKKWLDKNLPKINESVELFVYTAARDNNITLIGFENFEDKLMFERLLKVSSVGPKTALLVLSSNNAKEIEIAVEAQNIDFFLAIKGLAKKTAQKIVIELRSQFKALAKEKEKKEQEGAGELVAALQSMDFSQPEIKKVLPLIDPKAKLDIQVKEALRLLK